jgi:hypothetical protein
MLLAAPLPYPDLGPLDHAVAERAIDRIVADDRLCGLLAHLDDDDSLRRTFLSLYFQALNAPF